MASPRSYLDSLLSYLDPASPARAELIPIDPEAADLLNRMQADYPDVTHYAHSSPKKIGVSAGKAAESDIGMTNVFGATRTRSRNPDWAALLDAIGIPLDSLITVPYSNHDFVSSHMSNLIEADRFFGKDPKQLQERTAAHEFGHALVPNLSEALTDLFTTRPLKDPSFVHSVGYARGVDTAPFVEGWDKNNRMLQAVFDLHKQYGDPSNIQQIDWHGPPRSEDYLDKYWTLINLLSKFNEPGKHNYRP